MVERINKLIRETQRNPFAGVGNRGVETCAVRELVTQDY